MSAVLEFLTREFMQGKQYRTINSYRSAISMTHAGVDGVVVGKHPLVSRLMKGIYNQRPPKARYPFTWDVKEVLDHIRSWGPTSGLPLNKLTLKLAMLLALANASRSSELHALDVKRMAWSAEGVTFSLAALTKTSRPGKSKALFYQNLDLDKELCPVNSIKEYLKRTYDVRKDDNLFLSYVKPYRPVKPCSIARWLKVILQGAGLGTFRAHSTRGAAVTAAFAQGMSVADILAVADWSSDSMFKKHYYRPVIQRQNLSFSQSFVHN